MGTEVNHCKGHFMDEFFVYNDNIKCEGYESQIYSQLERDEQLSLKQCGIKKATPEVSMKEMFFKDANYLDALWYKKEGAFYNTTYNFENVILKDAQDTKDFVGMIIPRSYTAEELVEPEYEPEDEPEPEPEPQSEEKPIEKNKTEESSGTLVAKAETKTYILSEEEQKQKEEEDRKKREFMIKQFFKFLLEKLQGKKQSSVPIVSYIVRQPIEPIKLLQYEPPTNKLSHSLYLNIDLSKDAKKRRKFKPIMFNCQTPNPPPPTPPQVLAMQKALIKRLEKDIDLIATACAKLVDTYFQSVREYKYKNQKDDIKIKYKSLEDYKNKKNQEKKIIEIYQENNTIVSRLKEKIEEKKESLEDAKKYKEFVEKAFEEQEASKKTKTKVKEGESKEGDVKEKTDVEKFIEEQVEKLKRKVIDKLKSIIKLTEAEKAFEEFKKRYGEIKNLLTDAKQYTIEDVKDAKKEYERQEKNVSYFESQMEGAKVKLQESHKQLLEETEYEKSPYEAYIDSYAGIPPYTEEQIEKKKKEKIKYNNDIFELCNSVEVNYNTLTKAAFGDTITFVNTVNNFVKKDIIPVDNDENMKQLTPFQEKIIDVMMHYPILDEHAFDVYDKNFDFPLCDKKISPAPPSNTETEINGRSLYWVPFETAIIKLSYV